MPRKPLVETQAPWTAVAAYLWILCCDSTDLAWEYLRRNPSYWHAHAGNVGGLLSAARPWGLLASESPIREARDTQPVWLKPPANAVVLQRGVSGTSGAALSLWEVPGRKSLVADGNGLHFHVVRGAVGIRLVLTDDFIDGAPVAWQVPAGNGSAWSAIQAYDAWLFGRHPAATPALSLRTAVTHMHTLQALDGVLEGATHREIATALFGAKHVAQAWCADGDLRARTRFLIRRGLRLMRGGYVDLLWPPERAARPRAGHHRVPGSEQPFAESP